MEIYDNGKSFSISEMCPISGIQNRSHRFGSRKCSHPHVERRKGSHLVKRNEIFLLQYGAENKVQKVRNPL